MTQDDRDEILLELATTMQQMAKEIKGLVDAVEEVKRQMPEK